MSNLTYDEPMLPHDSDLTGSEPELSGSRRCPSCGGKLQHDLFGKLLCPTCKVAKASQAYNREPLPTDPEWFTAGNTVPVRHIQNVRAGRHPLGAALSDNPTATCGNCEHHYRQHADKTYHKCNLVPVTHSPGSDLRVKWRGCEHWIWSTDNEIED